jgi:hypothetical protein
MLHLRFSLHNRLGGLVLAALAAAVVDQVDHGEEQREAHGHAQHLPSVAQ